MESQQERAYRSAFRKVEALQIELARHVYSVQRRQEAERKLEEAMKMLDRARKELIKLRNEQRAQSA
jgi:anaerobic glycerol-3-phosphate dehydrogenase